MELFCFFTVSSWWSCYVCLQRAADGAVLFTVNSWWSCFVCLQWTADGAVLFVYSEQLMELFCLLTVNSWLTCFVCLQWTVVELVLFVYSEQLMELFCLFTVNSWWSCFVCLHWTADWAVLFVYSEQLMELFSARARRRFSRWLKRKPMALIKRLRKAKKEAPPLEKPEVCISKIIYEQTDSLKTKNITFPQLEKPEVCTLKAFSSHENSEILNRLENSGKIKTYYLLFLVIFKWTIIC